MAAVWDAPGLARRVVEPAGPGAATGLPGETTGSLGLPPTCQARRQQAGSKRKERPLFAAAMEEINERNQVIGS